MTRGSFEPVGRDRVIAKLASFIARAVYRDIEVHWSTPPQTSGSELTVANHFGGVADAILLLDTMPRPPGIIASDAIWKFPVVGWLMNLVGAIPVHKPEGGDTRSANDQMFATCYEALREGRHILIFPEGVTRNEPNIAEVKTGAARIALGARADGAEGITITPVGIFYEDKAALRSRVVINVGVPIALDDAVDRYEEATGTAAVTSDDRDAVGALTDEIERALRAAGPDYEDWAEARALTKGADIGLRGTLSDPRQPVPIGLRDRLGNVLAERPAQQRADVCAAVSSYDRHLDGLGVTDADVYGRSGLFRFAASVVSQLVVALFILPFAIVGAIINFVPYMVVKAVGFLNVAPSVHSTIKPIAAIVAFGITWGLLIWQAWSTFGIAGAGAAMVLLPIYLAATMLFLERMSLLWRTIGRQGRAGRVGPSNVDLETERAAVVQAVWAA